MEETQEELKSQKQKKLLHRLVKDLSSEHMDFYYQPTTEISYALKAHIENTTNLTQVERALLNPLSEYDIQILLSLNSRTKA
ncbi:MAG: hypothetical protein AB8B63_05295 [Granulosicoccus sp.]